MTDNADFVLLTELHAYLHLLNAPGSEARLDMATWPNCIGGYAARHPGFVRLGLHWQGGIIVFGPDNGFEALERFFGLTSREGDYLFANHPERTGFEPITSFAEAIARITHILNREEF